MTEIKNNLKTFQEDFFSSYLKNLNKTFVTFAFWGKKTKEKKKQEISFF